MKLLSAFVIAIVAIAFSGCGAPYAENFLSDDPSSTPDDSRPITRAQAFLKVEFGNQGAHFASSGIQPISVVNAPSVRMTLDTSQFVIPEISNSVMDFGFLAVTDLFDNQLRICGKSGNVQCGRALLRMYTIHQSGAGIFNSLDNFGAPIIAGNSVLGFFSVGLDVLGAAELQSYTIPVRQHVMRLADFAPAPKYQIAADFTDAGAGTYTTTLVLEYALAL